MPTCPRCGAETIPPYRFCSACGQPLGAPATPIAPAPYLATVPLHRDTTLLTIIVVVVVVIVVSAVTVAVVYNMAFARTGGGPPGTKPLVTLVVTKITGGVSILVAGIQPPVSPADFKLDIQNATSQELGAATAMPAVGGTSVPIAVSGVIFTIRWNNVGGSGFVSQGDTFVVTYSAPLGTVWAFLLIWMDGSALPTNANWQT